MKLYLVRHAIAEERSPSADISRASTIKTKTKPATPDAERALTPQGKAKMMRAAQGLRKIKVRPDTILTSPLRRARETAEILAEALGGIEIEVLDELAPGTELFSVVAALRRYHSLKALALVGHQPDLGYLASFLLAGTPSACELNLKKGAVACLEGELSDNATACSLLWLLPPKLLRTL